MDRHDYNQKMIDYGIQKAHGALMDTCLNSDKGPLSKRAVANQIFALWANEIATAARDERRERTDFAAVMFGPVISYKMRTIRKLGRDNNRCKLWDIALRESGHA